jgi:hypothetical protein
MCDDYQRGMVDRLGRPSGNPRFKRITAGCAETPVVSPVSVKCGWGERDDFRLIKPLPTTIETSDGRSSRANRRDGLFETFPDNLSSPASALLRTGNDFE